MIRGWLFIFLLSHGYLSFSQKALNDGPARLITKFPFRQLSGGVIMIQAKFDKVQEPLNFILDTGSGAISLDSETTAEFKIPHVPSGRTINGIAGITEVDYTQNKKLILPGLTVDSLDFYINNYDILSSVYGEKIDGIIGYSFLSRYIIKINFDSLIVEVYTPGTIQYPTRWLYAASSFYCIAYSIFNYKRCKNRNGKFLYGYRRGLCFLISKAFEEDSVSFKKA